jgi:exodeoxyribonuclease VII large subunit
LNPVLVSGEIGSFVQAASGHCYFNLKDADAQLRCAMFRRATTSLARLPQNGERVDVIAKLGVHAPRGDLQLIVEDLRPAGQGSAMEQFLRLKELLENEGLFAPIRKRPLVKIPRCIGLVTSPDAAALSDVLTALCRRDPHIPVILAPSAVQGVGAERAIVQALESLYARVDDPGSDAGSIPEVILVVRGGGAWEDLHAFNDESVARCIARSPVPVVAGIGHETDFTIADFVADMRAATPTAAAELCAAPVAELMLQLNDLALKLDRSIIRITQECAQRLDWLAANLSRPDDSLRAMHIALEHLAQQLRQGMPLSLSNQASTLERIHARLSAGCRRQLDARQVRIAVNDNRLATSNPTKVLSRGFAWLEGPQGLIASVSDIEIGDSVRATLVDGVVELLVSSNAN